MCHGMTDDADHGCVEQMIAHTLVTGCHNDLRLQSSSCEREPVEWPIGLK